MAGTSNISLVPQSGLQFHDVDLDLGASEGWDAPVWFRPRPADSAIESLTAEQRRMTPGEGFSVAPADALRIFSGEWIPLPFFRLRVGGASTDGFDRAPTNWARIRFEPIVDEDEPPALLRGVLAIDTAFARAGQETLAPQRIAEVQEFALCASPGAALEFAALPWVDDWMREIVTERPGAAPASRKAPREMLHQALFAALLTTLERTGALPKLRLVDVVTRNLQRPIDVDFVLDVGNSRTCGLLVEADAGDVDLNDSYPLELRDVEWPRRRSCEPFESGVEFTRTSFGREMFSRNSGRQFALNWPSPVRVGPEAVRLASAARGNEGQTGVSTPKRYLWDVAPSRQFWHFNAKGPHDALETVRGNFMRHLHESGAALVDMPAGSPVAGRALFSRSSMFMFMMIELLLHALRQINAPDNRKSRRDPETPRRLRRIVLTIPTTMPMAEQRILRKRAQSAVWCVWRLMGWSLDGEDPVEQPKVVVELDEASATHLVFLYTMVREMFGGSVTDLLKTSTPKAAGTIAQIRIASIDIGGGTTDLMVARYTLDRGVLVPEQMRREGPKLAGDDLLREIIQALVIPRLREGLEAAGLKRTAAVEFLGTYFSGPAGGVDEATHFFRRQFVLRVLEIAGLAILSADERRTADEQGEILDASLGDLLPDKELAARAIAHFEAAAKKTGARGFSVAAVRVRAGARDVAKVVGATMGPMLTGLCRIVREVGCDWLLLSGRPSKLHAVRDLIAAELPLWPHRILQMHDFEVGRWYPFRDSAGRIADPKTTAAVGATLAVYAERNLANFKLQSGKLRMKSTARNLGVVDLVNRIRNEDLLAQQPELSDKKGRRAVQLKPIAFTGPTYIGFRQQDSEDWPATPLMVLTWTNEKKSEEAKTPLSVKIVRPEIDVDAEDVELEALREAIEIEEVLDRHEDSVQHAGTPEADRFVKLSLRTMIEDAYWRDSAALKVDAS